MKPANMSDAEADRLADVVRQCYKDGVLTQHELNVLSDIADRFYPPNTAKTTEPIWDSRNSDEPKPT